MAAEKKLNNPAKPKTKKPTSKPDVKNTVDVKAVFAFANTDEGMNLVIRAEKEPGKECGEKITSVKKGTKMEVVEKEADVFYISGSFTEMTKVRLEDGTVGFAASKYLKF